MYEYIHLLGDDRIAEILISNGADVNLKNNDEETAAHIAAFIGYMLFSVITTKKNAKFYYYLSEKNSTRS